MASYYDEKRREISSTDQEVDAWEALRREPGLMGRLARRGKRMKPSYVGGRRSFQPPGRMAAEEKKKEERDLGGLGGSGAFSGLSGAANKISDYFGSATSGPRGESAHQGTGMERDNKPNQYLAGQSAAMEKEKQKKAEEKVKQDKLDKEKAELKKQRGELHDEYGGYKDKYGELSEQADYSGTRDALSGYQTQADALGAEGKDKYGGYESQIAQMEDRGAEVAGYGEDVAGLREGVGTDMAAGQETIGAAGQTMGEMATKATDTKGLMEDRGLFAGQMEAQRKAGQKGTLAKLRRSMAAGGASPQEIARAEAEASKGGEQQARSDALQSSMAAMQSKQGQMAQAGQFTGQQAQLAGQQAALGMQGRMQQGQLGAQAAGMAGQAQQLQMDKIRQQGQMYGAGVQQQQQALGMGSTLANQQQASLQGQIAQQAGLTGQQAGMTDAQMQNIVAQQNAMQQAQLGREGMQLQRDTNAAMQPQGPSTMDQVLQTAQTVAPIAMMAMSDKKAKKNVRSAKDKDLMGPEQIDGFLNDLYAYQYNYKNAGHGTGKQVGVMAQDLEKTQLGKQMVEKTPQGKQINAAKGLGLAMASQARLNQRLNSIGA